MRRYRKSLSLLLSAALLAAMALSGHALDSSFCSFVIDAAAMDFPQQQISIHLYQPASSGQLQSAQVQQLDCTLNRVTSDASFYVQPSSAGVQVSVDYLTDLNSDGVYELIEGGGQALVSQDSAILQPAGQAQALTAGQTYILSAQTLTQGYQQAVQARGQAGSSSYLGLASSGSQRFPLCRVTLSAQAQTLSYYVMIYDRVLLPLDVSSSSPYYSAVEYALSQGYLSGVGNGLFQPDAPVTRAQLAQILWRLGGSLAAAGVSFSDVSSDAWYYEAVSWCCSRGLMSGLPGNLFAPDVPLTREQTGLILYQYARLSKANVSYLADLSVYEDGDTVSSWAKTSLEWAVANGLLSSGSGDTIRPLDDITRGEMAMVLYAYDRLYIP